MNNDLMNASQIELEFNTKCYVVIFTEYAYGETSTKVRKVFLSKQSALDYVSSCSSEVYSDGSLGACFEIEDHEML